MAIRVTGTISCFRRTAALSMSSVTLPTRASRNGYPRSDKAQALLSAMKQVSKPLIAMSAHNPLSAKIAATTPGIGAIWVSGFELAASYAVPDANILPMSTHLEMTRAMAEAVPDHVPLIADIDTGFGNAVNVAYTVPKYATAGATAVVMEDKTFPKDSSLRPNGRQVLVSVEEFCGKLRAAKAGSDILVIARTEALIAGLGEDEAISRGEAYVESGADAVLIHSKQSTPNEILAFCHRWTGKAPLVLVPTSYPQLSFADIGKLEKVGLIICGNHAIRAAVQAMRKTFRHIIENGGLAQIEHDIATVTEVFELQGDQRMRAMEKEYLR